MKKATLVFCYPNDKTFSIEDWGEATFVIRMLSSGFCLAILSEKGNILSLNRYSFLPNLSIEEKIEAIENARELYHLRCGKTIFQLYTNINTQIPEDFYVENLNNTIADLLVPKSKDYVPLAEKIAKEPLYNISLWNAVLLKKIKEKFPNYELRTTMGSLLAKIEQRKPQEECFVFVEDNNFTIIAKNENGLLACNCFDFENEADFLYYCLLFLRKLYPNIEAVPLALGGNIATQFPLFQSLKKYMAKVELIEKNNEAIDPIVNYHYYCDIF